MAEEPSVTQQRRVFRDWLSAELRRREWSQAELSRRSGLSTSVISRWLKLQATPDTESCDRIADVLGVEVDTVLTLAGHRPHADEPRPDDRVSVIASKLRRAKLTDDELEGIEETVELLIKQAKRFRRA